MSDKLKVLVVFPSSIPVSSGTNTNGLVFGGLCITQALDSIGRFDFTLFGNVTSMSYPVIKSDHTGKRNHNQLMLKHLAEVCNDFDLVHVHSNFYLSTKFIKFLEDNPHPPFIITQHSALMRGITAYSAGEGYMKLFDLAHVTYPSGVTYEDVCDYYKTSPLDHPHTIISNFYDDFGYNETPDYKVISVIARMDRMKNVLFTLQQALKDAKELSYKVVYVGESKLIIDNPKTRAYRDEVLSFLEANQEHISHTNSFDRSQLQHLLHHSSALYHFTTMENQALVPGEAMSTGCPTIGYKSVLTGNKRIPECCGVFVESKGKIKSNCNLLKIALAIPRSSIRSNYELIYDHNTIKEEWYNLYIKALL